MYHTLRKFRTGWVARIKQLCVAFEWRWSLIWWWSHDKNPGGWDIQIPNCWRGLWNWRDFLLRRCVAGQTSTFWGWLQRIQTWTQRGIWSGWSFSLRNQPLFHSLICWHYLWWVFPSSTPIVFSPGPSWPCPMPMRSCCWFLIYDC